MVAVQDDARPRVASSTLPPERYLARARDLVDAHYGEPLTVDDMADAAGLSKAHFSVEFRRAQHRTFRKGDHRPTLPASGSSETSTDRRTR